jgi:hypothetical protein
MPLTLKRSVLALAAAFPLAATAAADAEIRELREQIKQLREAYEQRIDALERRLAQVQGAATPPVAPPAAARPGAGQGGAFNPDISLILQGVLARQSRDPADYRLQGFVPAGEPQEIGPPKRRGFTLQESELVMSANVDPYFRGQLNLALTPDDSVEVEEAFFQTLSLSQGLGVKAGRFLSAVGYHNEQHPHSWDFADAPLAYAAFFGNRLVAEGLQLRWVAPTELFLELGAEAGRDDRFPGSGRNKQGSGMGALFAHVGSDVSASHSWRAGLSWVGTSPRDRSYDDVDSLDAATTNAFSGRSRTAVADFVWKWAPGGNPRYTNFKLQGEYFRRRETGTLASNSAAGLCGGDCADAYRASQSGYYLQGVYQFAPQWRLGYRFDRLDSGALALGLLDSGTLSAADFPALQGHKPKRHTLMADYSPSEFSRLRLQLARDSSRLGRADNQLWLQYIMSLGSHGAHKF